MKHKRLTTLTLNPCIDKSIVVDGLKKDGLNRAKSVRYDVGGKGINLSVAFNGLGGDGSALYINYFDSENRIEDYLNAMGIKCDFIDVDGNLRENLKIFDDQTGFITEINEKGGYVDKKSMDALVAKVKHYANISRAMAMCGSLPKGVSDDIYYRLLMLCQDSKAFKILDTEKERLLSGVKAKPDMIKPNLFELNEITGQTPKSFEEIAKTARDFVMPYGVSYICVSMGSDGAMLVTKEKSFFAPALKIKVKGATGAGDSFIAGFVKGLFEGVSDKLLLAYGVAAASDSVEKQGTMLCREHGFLEKLKQVRVSKID